MLPIIENRTNRLIYVAEKRDGSGVVSTGTDVHLKIHNITDNKWWTGAAWDTETELDGTHLSNGVWYYNWATPDGDAGDRVEWFFYNETDETVVLYEEAEVIDKGGLAIEATVQEGMEDILHCNWPIVYVQTGATGAADGTSWTDAYTTIQAAIDAADNSGTIIVVGAGFYSEAITIDKDKISLRAFDWNVPVGHSNNSIAILGAADTPTVTIAGDYDTMIGIVATDHATGTENGIDISNALSPSIVRCTIRALNGQLATGIKTTGTNSWGLISQVHIDGAEQYGIDFSGTDSHLHVWDCSVEMEDGASAAIAVSGTGTDIGIKNTTLQTTGTVAAGFEFGNNSSRCRATRCAVRGFTAIYDDNGTNNSFIDCYDMVAPADGADYTAARAAYLDNIDAIPGLVWDHDLVDKEVTGDSGSDAGEMLVASRAGIIGRMSIVGTTVTFYELDGTTVIFTATLDSATVPTSRTKPA